MIKSTQFMTAYPIESFLAEREDELKEKIFTSEKSDLSQINTNFSPIYEKDFLQWLEFLNNTQEALILEIGGGINQVAASQILTQFPQVNLWEIELRPVEEQIKQELERTGRYHLFNLGLSQALNQPELEQKKFSLIFAHNVLHLLPNPFFVIENCYQLLEDGGLIFVNGILIYEEEWEKIANFLQEQGYQFSWKKIETPSNLKKKGVVSISLTLEKNKEDIHFPLIQGRKLTDIHGQELGPFEYFFDSTG